MSSKDNVKKLIQDHYRKLQKLKEQQAKLGLHTPHYILTEIEDTEAEIAKLQIELDEPEKPTFFLSKHDGSHFVSTSSKKLDPVILLAIIALIATIITAVTSVLVVLIQQTPAPTAALLVFVTPTPISTLTEAPPEIPTLTTPGIAYYAAFGIQFPEGAWREGKTYSYFMQIKECGKNNFVGDTVSFDVLSRSEDMPFYLLKDGIYDNADRNIARHINASSTQKSYAAVVIPRASAQEATQVLNTCQVFLNLKDAPSLALEPSKEGVVLASNFPEKLNLDSFVIVPNISP